MKGGGIEIGNRMVSRWLQIELEAVKYFFFSATVAPAPIPQTFVNVACRLARLPALWLMKRHRIDES